MRFGYRVPFALAAALALLTVVLTLALLPESKGAVKTAPTFAEIRASLRSPVLGRLLLTQFAFAIAFTSWVTVLALYAERVYKFGPAQTASIFVVSSIVSIVVQLGLIGALVDRYGEGRIAIAGLACAAVAYGAVGFAVSVPALFAFVVLWSFSSALIRPSLGSLISSAAPASQRGTILSINDSLNWTAFLLAPFVSTTVLTVNPRVVGVVPSLFALVALAIGYRFLIAPPGQPVAIEAA